MESLTSEKKRLSQSLDHKTKKALDLETKYDVTEYCGFYFRLFPRRILHLLIETLLLSTDWKRCQLTIKGCSLAMNRRVEK